MSDMEDLHCSDQFEPLFLESSRASASITPKGAFFCEVAGAIDLATNGPGGWPLEKGWWKKTVEDYTTQKNYSCLKCSAAMPMGSIPNNHVNHDLVSKGMNELLIKNGSPSILAPWCG